MMVAGQFLDAIFVDFQEIIGVIIGKAIYEGQVDLKEAVKISGT